MCLLICLTADSAVRLRDLHPIEKKPAQAVYRLPTKKQPLLDPHDVAAAWKLKPKKRVLFTDSIPPWVPASLAEGHETRLSESHWA